jgi:hypothetical protein
MISNLSKTNVARGKSRVRPSNVDTDTQRLLHSQTAHLVSALPKVDKDCSKYRTNPN